MPNTVVNIDLRAETGAVPQPTYSDLVIIGRNPEIADPTTNTPSLYNSAATVATDFGVGSDVHTAALQIQEMGAREWWVVMLDTTTHTETVEGSDAGAVQSGTLSDVPLRGGLDNITVNLDGAAQTIIPTTETAPSAPSSGEVKINFDTGELITGDASSGASTGIVVDYETLSWSEAISEMTPRGLDLAIMADTRADKSYIGEFDELVSWASTNDSSVILAYENGANYADDTTAMNAYHEMGEYLTSGNLYTIAHKSAEDVAAGVAGRLATKQPWFDPFWDGGADYNFDSGSFRSSLVGSPSQPGTFEGGDVDGNGPTNVLKTVQGVQILSNSLTTAGAASNYQYFDVRRTETFIETEIKSALEALRLRRDQIPFADIGRTLIQDAITTRLNQYVSSGGFSADALEELQNQDQNDPNPVPMPTGPTGTDLNGVPLSNLEVYVPPLDDLSQDDLANRRWTGVQVGGTLAGNVHEFGVQLTVQV